MVVEISDWNDLDNVRNDLTGDYVLVNDLDSETDGYVGTGDDFTPIGVGINDNFNGTFDGDGFAINDLVVEIDSSDIGLFGAVSRDTSQFTIIENLSVSGSVTNTGAGNRAGGLAGFLDTGGTGTIQNCVSHVDVTALDSNHVGGLVGLNSDTVTDSYATGSVDGFDNVGGLVGDNRDTIQTSYAVGLVTGNTDVGALVGRNTFADELSDSYADEETTGQTDLTGDGEGPITNSYTLTTSEMQGDEASNTGNMDGFDYTNVWSTVEVQTIETDTINGQITLDDVAAETATVILHNFSEPESIGFISEDGYPILLSVDKGNQLDSQNVESGEQGNIARTETDTNGNYSAEIPSATGDTIAVAVDFDDGTDRYGRLVTTVLE